MRCFVALELPAEPRRRIETLGRTLRRELAAVRWVRPEGIHLTLKFLGELPEERLAEISDALSGSVAGAHHSTLQLSGLGVFPSPRAPRVIWVGFAAMPEALLALQRRVERAMAAQGFPREKRPFAPHLTLGRFRGRLSASESRRLGDLLGRYRDEDLGSFEADRVVLYQSLLRPEGARYTALRTWMLPDARSPAGNRNGG